MYTYINPICKTERVSVHEHCQDDGRFLDGKGRANAGSDARKRGCRTRVISGIS
jgi:hypothetical protein